MKPLKLKITGGPYPKDIKVFDLETGEQISNITKLSLDLNPNVGFATIFLEAMAIQNELELDLELFATKET